MIQSPGASPSRSGAGERRLAVRLLPWQGTLSWLGLAAIVAVAFSLRFYALTQRGLIFWDEAKFALEGIRARAALDLLLGLGSGTAGKAIGSAKPTHALLIALSYAVFGVHDYAPLLMNAAASVGAVILVFLIARRLFDAPTGLIAALFLAVSEYDVMYARSALSESDSTFLLLLGVWVWVTARRREVTNRAARVWSSLWLAGVLLGLAFTANYRLIVYVAAIVGFDVLWCWYQQGWRRAARSLGSWALGFPLAPLIWQAADIVSRQHGLVLFQGDLMTGTGWYFRQIYYQLHEGKQAVLRFEPQLYVQWYVARQGWASLLLVIGGLVLAAQRRTFAWLTAAVPLAVAFVVYTFAPFVVPRNLVAALPFAAILAAAAMVWSARLIRPARLSAAVLLAVSLLLALGQGEMAWRLTAERSGFARAAAYLQPTSSRRALTTSEIMVFYLRGHGTSCAAPSLPLTLAGLAASIHDGYRYAVLENHNNSAVTRYIRAHATPVARYLTLGWLNLPESPISSENSNPPGTDPLAEHVDVFWLGNLRLPDARPPRVAACDQNRVT